MHTLKVKVKRGKVETEVQGIAGPGCHEATQWVRDRYGVKVVEDRQTAAFDEVGVADQESVGTFG